MDKKRFKNGGQAAPAAPEGRQPSRPVLGPGRGPVSGPRPGGYYVPGFMAALLVLGLAGGAFAYTGQWTQADWAGGVSQSTAAHPGDQAGWTNYQSKSSTVTYMPGAGLQLQNQTFSWVTTDNTTGSSGFLSTGYSLGYSTISGAGNDAYLRMHDVGNASDGFFDTDTYVSGIAGITKVSGTDFTIDVTEAGHKGVYNFANFTVRAGVTVRAINGPYPSTNYLVIRATSAVTIYGTLSVSANGQTAVAGGGTGGSSGCAVSGQGLGGGCPTGGYCDSGNGGGYGGQGSKGYYGAGFCGGAPYGSNTLEPFYAGSGGGGGWSGPAGGGGGGLKIFATNLYVSGLVSANGGNCTGGETGGGSGGGILILVSSVSGTGSIQANGGTSCGDSGGGSGGRIRIASGNTHSYTVTANASAINRSGTNGTITTASLTAYVSGVFNTGGQFDYYDISWSSFVPAGGNIITEVRAGNTAVPDGSWTAWAPFTNGQNLGGSMDYLQYIQWRSSFTTVDASTSPILYDLTINYLGYDQAYNDLVSSVYDSGSSSNSLRQLRWGQIKPPSTDIKVQLRTSPDANNWTVWMGTNGASSSWFTDPAGSQAVPYALRDGLDDRYFQYKLTIKGSGQNTPTVTVSTVAYGSLAIPVINSLAADSSTQIRLDFTDNSDDEYDFKIATGVITGPNTDMGTITSTDPAGTGFQSGLATGLNPNTLYFIRLRSHETAGGGYSSFSNELSTFTLAAPPVVSTRPYEPTITNLKVYWEANNNPAGTQFYIEGDDDPAYGSPLAQSGWTTQTNQTFGGLTLGTTYYFRVKARNNYGVQTATVALHAAQPVADPAAVSDSIYQVWATSVTVKWDGNGNPAYTPYWVQRILDTVPPLSWWDLDGDWDDSFGGNNASAMGSPAFTAGRAGQALNLDGSSQYLQVPYTAALTLQSTPFTVAAWVKTTKTDYQVVMGNYSPGYMFVLNYPANNSMSYFNGTGWYSAAGGTLTDGAWHHVAWVYSSGQMTFYRDGAAINTQSVAAPANSGNWVGIGGAPGWLYLFSGDMDEVGVYNTAFSLGGIQSLVAHVSPYAPSTAGWAAGSQQTIAGLTPDTTYSFRVKAANPSLDEAAAWAGLGSTITLANTPAYIGLSTAYAQGLETTWGANGNPASVVYGLRVSTSADYSSAGTDSDITSPSQWSALAPAPNTVYVGGSMAGAGDYIYAFRGNSPDFWRYSPAANTWTSMAATPTSVTQPGSLLYPGYGDYIYATNNGTQFWRYSISGNSWQVLDNFPISGSSYGRCMAYPGSGDYIYALAGSNITGFYRYSMSNNAWTALAAAFSSVDNGGALVYGGGDYIYAFRGNNFNTFWRYSITTDVWATMTNAPWGTNAGGTLAYPGVGDYIYATQGVGGTGFARYSITGNNWTSLAATLIGVYQGGHLHYPGKGGYVYLLNGQQTVNFARYAINPAVMPGLTPMTTYYARVRAKNSAGTPTAWTDLGSAMTRINHPLWQSYGPDSSQITVNWNNLNGQPAETYIERATNGTFTAGLANSGWLSPGTTFYSFGGLAVSTQYYFRGKAREQASPANESAWGPFPPQATLPNAPSSLAHAFVSSGTIRAQWGANGNGAGTNYYAERATDAGFTANVTNSGWATATAWNAAVTPNTFYYFRVKARNASGTESLWTSLPTARSYANVPAGAAVANVLATQAQFSWNLNNNPSGTEFWAEIAVTSSPWTSISSAGWVTATGNLFTGLTQNVTYYFKVKARNAAMDEGINSQAPGTPVWTTVISTRTPIPPAAPSGLAVDLAGVSTAQTDRLHIRWNDNSNNEDGFTLERGPDGAGFTPLLNLSAGATEYMDTGLAVNTSYYYRVKAYSSSGGDSAYTNTGALHTRAAAPSAAAFQQASSATARVGWNANGNPAGTRFTVQLSTMADISAVLGSSATSASPASFTGLAPNTYHYARLKAVNDNGVDSDFSSIASTLTAAAPPVNPAFLSLWVSSLSVTWGANGNPDYTRYAAELSTAADYTGTPVSSATRNYWAETASLAPNTPWYFRVRALNEADSASAWVSPAAPAVTLAQNPGVSPASYIVNSSSVTVFWDNGGNPAWTQYNVQRSGRDSANFASVEDSSLWQTGRSSWTFYSPSLAAGATYYFRVKARNSAGVEAPNGAGNWIILPSTQTLANAPGLVPPDVFVSSMNARWVNTNQAGTPYLAEISELADYSVIAASSGWTNDIASYIFTGLASNTRYYVRARARNTGGVETAAAALYAEYTRAAEPGQPAGEYGRTGNSVTVNWDKSGNPDPGTEYFAVASSSADFSYNASSSPWVASNAYQFNGLLPGATYYFRARARNRNAAPLETAWTMLPSTITLPAPTPPSGLALTYPDAVSTDRVRLDWTDNADGEAGFRVYESVNGTDYYIKDTLGSNPGTGPLSYLAMALTPNKPYYYKVAAFNANGEAYTAAVSTYSRAAQPGALDFSQVLTNSLRANWDGGSNPAGTLYAAEISTMPGFVPLSASSFTLNGNAVFAGIEANKVYYARVKAVNGSGAATDYTALGSTQTIPLSITIAAYDQAPGAVTQGQRLSFARLVITPSGNGAQLGGITVRRTGNGADADVSRAAVWRDQNGDGGFQAGNDLETGWGVFAGSQAAIALNQTFSAPATFFVVLTAADNYLSWPGNTLGVTIASTASFTSPNSILASMSPAPLASGMPPITKLADTLDIFGANAAPMPNVSRGIYNTPFLKLTLNAGRDRVYLNRIAVGKLGTLAEGNIAAVKVFYDANKNGALEAGAGDELVSSGVDAFAGGQAAIQLVNPSTRAVTSEVYFITLDIIDTAPLNATVGLRVENAAAFTLMGGTPDSVTLAASPTDSALPAVSDPPNILYVTPASMGVVSVEQGAEKAFERLDLTADSGNAVVTSLKVQRSSTSVDADYTRVSLYRDNPPLGEYGPSDTFISSGVFSSGQVTFGLAENITYTSTKTYFVTAGISPSANTSNKAGISIQAGYITAISAQTTVSAPFPIYSGLAVITPTVDTVMVTPDASIAPSVAYQTNTDVPVLALKMQANANAADISAVILNQAGTAQDTDISSVRVFRDNGNGLFNAAQDTPVSGNYGFSNGSATISFSALQNITPSSVTYFVAANVAAAAVPGRTMQLRIAAPGSFNILVPDMITSTFPVLSNVITLEKLPAVVYASSASLAPAAAGAGTPDIQMERLLIRTNQSTSVMNSISLVRAGGGDADISGVALYWDFNSNSVLEPSELVSSGTFSGGFLSLPFAGSAKALSVSTKTYYFTMGISSSAAVNTTLGISFTNLSVNSPDSVESGRFPFASGGVLVAEPPSTLLCSLENKMPGGIVQGDSAVLVASMTLRASAYTADLTGIQVLRTGNGYDSDITAVKLYRDDGNGVWGGPAQETLVTAGAFASGAASLDFPTQTISWAAAALYYIAVDVSETAVPGKTFGISLPAASYVEVTDPDYADIAAFPFDSALAAIQPTVDTLMTVPVPLSLAPLLTQGDYRRSIGKITLRADAHSIELSGIKFSQSGTIPDADLSEALLYKDDGDGIFVSTRDAPVTFPTQLNAGTLQLLLSPAQVINTTPQTYWLAISVSSTASPGTTLSLDCPNTSYFSVTAPDAVDTAAFPFSFSVAGTLLDKPDTVRVLPENTAPAEADQGAAGNVMARLKVWADVDSAVFNRLRVDLSGSVAPSDISAVRLHKDLDSNGVLSGPDLALSSAAFSAGYVWLDLAAPQTITVATQTYFVSYDVAPGAAINAVARAGLAAASYVDVGSPDSVDGFNLPFTTGGMTIKEPAARVSMTFENKASTWAAQGQMDVLMSSFTLAVSSYNAQMAQLILRKAGNSPDADVAVFLYADNGNRTFGGFAQETLVASAPFSGGMATLQFSPVQFSASAPKLFFLAAKVASNAQPGKTAGFSLDAANYITIAAPDYLDPALVFPLATALFTVQATVDPLLVQAETAGLVPLLTQGDYRRAVGKLTLRSGANSVELSGIKFSQGGTATGADITEALLYRDNGDGVFVSTADTPVTLPTALSGSTLQLMMLTGENITTAPQVYWLALSVATNASVGATVALNCAATSYLNVSAPDTVDPAAFPFSIAVPGNIQDKPDTVRIRFDDTAPASADQGSTGNVMARLKLWTDVDKAALNRLRVDLSGSAGAADIAAVKLYRDADLSGGLSGGDLLLASAAFSGNYAWLNFSPAQNITVSTRTYFIAYDVSAAAASGVQARAAISGPSYLDIDGPDTADGGALPFSSSLMTVSEPPALVSVVFADRAPATALQGQFDLLLASFTVSVSTYNAYFSQLVARRTGTGSDSDAALYLYEDDGNGVFNGYGADLFLASAAFSGGAASLQFGSLALNAAAPRRFFLAAGISYGAQPYKTFGLSLDAAGYFSIAAPDQIDPALAFPLATALAEIRPTSDTLLAQAESLNLTPLLTQGDQRRAVGKITLRSSANSVEVSNIKFSLAGTASGADITEFTLYKDDGDGVFLAGADAAATLPASGADGTVQLVFSPVRLIATAPQVYWLTVSVATLAAPGATLTLACPDTGYLTLSSMDSADPASFPLAIQVPGALQDMPDTLRVSLEDLAPTSVYQGRAGNPMARLKLWTDQDGAVWRGLRVDLTGNAAAADISAVRLYADSDGNGAFGAGSDALLASGAFIAGYAWLNLASPQYLGVSTGTYFVVYDFSPTAAIDVRAGISVSGGAYFNIDSPDSTVQPAGFASGFSVVRDPRIPLPPAITVVKADGTLAIREAAYNPYETMLKFKWDGDVYQGSLERVEYNIGPSPAVSTSSWTSIGLLKDAVATNLDLANGGTYYLSLRAKNALGSYYSDIVSQRVVVDSFRPLLPASGTVMDEAGGVKVSWPAAVTGASGLDHYAIEERPGSSPVWKEISTTTATSLVIAKSGYAPQSMARAPGTYYYRVKAVSGAGVSGEYTEPMVVNIDLDKLASITGLSAYPNPFDSRKTSVTINFTLNRDAKVKMSIYDLFGSKIKSVSFGGTAGVNETVWDGADNTGRKVSKGMYICVIRAAGGRKTVKIGVLH